MFIMRMDCKSWKSWPRLKFVEHLKFVYPQHISSAMSSFSVFPEYSEEKSTTEEEEEFTVIKEYALYLHGEYVRDLTEKEKETDPVVLECRKHIEEEKERILLGKSVVMSGGSLPTVTGAEKTKKTKKSILEKTRSKTRLVLIFSLRYIFLCAVI